MAIYNSDIRKKFNKYFQEKLHLRPYRNGWLKGKCPYCGKEEKFGVSINKDQVNCFRCGGKGSLLKLVMDLESIETYNYAKKFIYDLDSNDYFDVKEEQIELNSRKDVLLPESFKVLSLGNSTFAKSARSYISNRGFDIKEMSLKGWGYCTKGKYSGYIIMPFYENHKLVYFHARAYLTTGPRYNNPDLTVTGIGKNQVWYNSDSLCMYDTVYITEGVFNSETIGDKSIASGGKAVSDYQVDVLLQSPVKNIIILLDSDAPDRAYKLANELILHKNVKIVTLPLGKDPNDIGKQQTIIRSFNTPFLNLQDLYKFKFNIKK